MEPRDGKLPAASLDLLYYPPIVRLFNLSCDIQNSDAQYWIDDQQCKENWYYFGIHGYDLIVKEAKRFSITILSPYTDWIFTFRIIGTQAYTLHEKGGQQKLTDQNVAYINILNKDNKRK